MKGSLSLVFFLIACQIIVGQSYIDGGKTRHRFAQLNLGVDLRTFLPEGSKKYYINSLGLLQEEALTKQTESRLIIGGTHFWGHTDFYIAFPIASFGKSGFTTGAETGVKIFPWQIKNRKVRPFLGIAWLPNDYQQAQGVNQLRNAFPLITGFVYNYKNQLFELSAGYNFHNTRTYYISINNKAKIKTHPLWVSLGYKWMIETTVSAEKNWKSSRTKMLTDTLGELGKLNGVTFSIGPSSAIFLKKSRHNKNLFPFLDDHKISNIFPEFGFGYYFHRPDVQLNLAYRNINSQIEAYGFSQSINRRSLNFEAYAFLTDYHGFAVFAGGAVSHENLNVHEQNPFEESKKTSKDEWYAGVVFGWDIRPDRLQSWYLRTNIRWFPGLNVEMDSGKDISLDQLEFNFIQLVVFPSRMF